MYLLPDLLFYPYRFANEIINGDTFTTNDSVRTQYENLPYPQFTPMNISNEESYYKKDIQVPISIHSPHTLEKHNHYLHGGNQNFR